MKLKDLTPKGIKINEAKMTPAKVHKIQKDLVTTIDLLKKNFPKYKEALDANDEKKLKKHRDIAVKLTKKKKDLESDLDKALGGLYQDAELELDESSVFGDPSDQDVADAEKLQGALDSRDVDKLQKKFDGPLDPVLKLINKKEELAGAVQALIQNVEQEKPGLAKKTKILLKKMVMDL
jgi:hypothetical protein